MAIYYRQIYKTTTPPLNPQKGDGWLKPVTGAKYQFYMYTTFWKPIKGGGIQDSESGGDEMYINVVIQEDLPDDIIKVGWFWIKESLDQIYFYIWDYDLIG